MSKRVEIGDFFGPAPPPRIIGLETEYTVDSHLLYGFSSRAKKKYGMRGGFLPNGSRMYPDLENIEYCSGEALGPLDAAASDHAGIPILLDLYNASVQDVAKLTSSKSRALFKKFSPLRRAGSYCGLYVLEKGLSGVYDDIGYATMGYHENFLTPISPENADYITYEHLVQTFLATRHVWTGAGMVLHDGTLELSQKMTDAEAKQLMQVRCEPEKIGQFEDASILEVRTADAHMLPYATYLELASMSLVLRLYEQGVIHSGNIADWTVVNPYWTASCVSTINHEQFDERISLENGEKISIVTYQRRLAELANELASDIALPEDEVFAAREWLKIMKAIEVSGFEDPYLLGRVEHVTKEALMRHIASRKDRELDAMERIAIDLSFTTVDQHLARSALKLFGDSDVKRASIAIYDQANQYTSHPPRTRAAQRGSLINSHKKQITAVDWGHVATIDGRFDLSDPYESSLQTASFRSER